MSESKRLLQLERSLMMSSGIQVACSLHSNRQESLLSFYQVVQLQFARLQEKGQVQFSMIPNENEGKN